MCQCYFYRIGPEIMCTVFGEMFCKKLCFGENSKWQNIYIGTNGRGLCRVMCHGPRHPGKNNIDFTTYGSYGYKPKRKEGCYSATMWPMWEFWGRGSSLASRECVCKVWRPLYVCVQYGGIHCVCVQYGGVHCVCVQYGGVHWLC